MVFPAILRRGSRRQLVFVLLSMGLGTLVSILVLECVGLFLPGVLPFGVQRLLDRGPVSRSATRIPDGAIEYTTTIYNPETVFEVTTRGLDPRFDRGFRDDGVQNPPPFAAAVGDSFTFGWGVRMEEGWVERLEQGLRRDIVNLTPVGRAPSYHIEVIRNYALPLRPRVVFYGAFQNDYRDEAAYLDYLESGSKLTEREWREQREIEGLSVLGKLAHKSTVLALAKLAYSGSDLGRKNKRVLHKEESNRYVLSPQLLKTYLSPDDRRIRSGFQRTMEIILEAKQLCEGAGVRFVVLYFPLKEQVYFDEISKRLPGFQVEKLKAGFFEFCREHDIEVFDLTEVLSRHKHEQLYFEVDGHWTARGHEVVSRALQDYIGAWDTARELGRDDPDAP